MYVYISVKRVLLQRLK